MRTTIIRILILIITCLCAKLDLPAQQIIGASGLLRSPSADMYPDGTAIIGGNYLNQEVLPLLSITTAEIILSELLSYHLWK